MSQSSTVATLACALPKLGYSIREACQATSLGRSTIFKILADPTSPLKAVRVGGRTIIPAEALHKLLAGQE